MLYRNTAIESRDGTPSAIMPAGIGLHGRADDFNERRNRFDAERAIDEVLAESFPASDPPSWNPGVSRPAPAVSIHHEAAQSNGRMQVPEERGHVSSCRVQRQTGRSLTG